MANEYNDKVSLAGSATFVKTQSDLVQRGLQSRIRAIMALYAIEREEAEKVMTEIQDEWMTYGQPPIIPFPEDEKK